MLGGNISFESELDKGSTFRVRIPIGGEEIASESTKNGADVERLPAEPLRNRRILVVDDLKSMCDLLSWYIREAAGSPEAVTNGRAAVQAVERAAASNPFDAIILDVQMPAMDGYEVVRTLRAKGVQIPVIALTAGAMAGDRERCLQAGFDDYLSKPIDRRKLVQLIADHTPSHSLNDQAAQ
jgi:CheY-like chemotaxis protein